MSIVRITIVFFQRKKKHLKNNTPFGREFLPLAPENGERGLGCPLPPINGKIHPFK